MDKNIDLPQNIIQEELTKSNNPTSKISLSQIKTFREKVTDKRKSYLKSKGDISSMIPSIAQNKDKEGFISYSKENLNEFQSMCDELKRQITSEQNGINNDSNFLFGYQKTEKDRNHSELLEAIEQRKTIKDEYEKKYRKLISRTVPLYDSNSDNEDIGLFYH